MVLSIPFDTRHRAIIISLYIRVLMAPMDVPLSVLSVLFSTNWKVIIYKVWFGRKKEGKKTLYVIFALGMKSVFHPPNVIVEGEKERNKTSHPRIAHGQRYQMPCLELLVKEVE